MAIAAAIITSAIVPAVLPKNLSTISVMNMTAAKSKIHGNKYRKACAFVHSAVIVLLLFVVNSFHFAALLLNNKVIVTHFGFIHILL